MTSATDSVRENANTTANWLTFAVTLASAVSTIGLVYFARKQAETQLKTHEVTKTNLEDASQRRDRDNELKENDIRDLQDKSQVQGERLDQCLRNIGDLRGILPKQERLFE